MINTRFILYSAALLFSFILSQYYYFNYYLILETWNYFLYIYYFVLALFFYVGWKKNLNLYYFFSIIILAIAWVCTYDAKRSLVSMALFALFAAVFLLSFLAAGKKSERDMLSVEGVYDNEYRVRWYLLLIMVFVAVVAALRVPLMLEVFIEQTAAAKNLYTVYVSGGPAVFNYISSNPKVVFLVVSYILFFVLGSEFFIDRKIGNEVAALVFLLAATFLAKLITILVINDGFKWISDVITNKCITDYYFYTKDIENIRGFVGDYILYQTQQMGVAMHMRTHPPLVAVMFWFFCKITGCTPVAVGMCIMALTSFISLIIYYIIKLISGEKVMAFAGAMLYIVSGNSIIQSRIITDAVIALVFGIVILLIVISNKYGKLWAALIAGLFFGAESYLQFSAWIQLCVILPLFFVKRHTGARNILNAALYGIVFASGIMIFHILFPLLTSADFNYITSFKMALSYFRQDGEGVPYTTWWWLGGVNFFRAIGSGTAALLLLRYWSAVTGKIKLDGYSFACLAAMMIYFLSGMLGAWKAMYLIILVIPPAAIALFSVDKGKINCSRAYLFAITIFMYLETMGYLFFIRDTQ